MEIDWFELENGSRDFEINRRSASKTFTFIVQSKDFLELAGREYLPGTNLEMIFDDIVAQQAIIPIFAGEVVPLTYLFWYDTDKFIELYPSSLTGRAINWDKWLITVVYDVPDDNGQSQGGGGGETGPSNGEANSTEFTQLSFNSSVSMEKRQQALLVEAQRSTAKAAIAAPLPYTPGRVQYVGLTDDGIEGAEVPVRSFSFEITQYMAPTKLTYAYVRKMSRLATCLNSKVFFGFAPLSVMCMGGQGQGHIFQRVPVTLSFEVRTNFKLVTSGAKALAAAADVLTTLPNGKKQVNTSTQFDTYPEPDFPSTAVNWSASGIDLPAGVHSGWSIVNYLYEPLVKTDSKRVVTRPVDRLIYLPEDCIFADFNEYLQL